MTNGEKATAALSYLDGLDTTTVINVLNPYLDDDELAGLYDKLVSDGFIEEPRPKAKRIAFYDESDDCYDTLTNEYQNFDLDSFVARVKVLHPEIIRDDEAEEIEGEIQDENDRYILTWEDSMCECVRIYEKV